MATPALVFRLAAPVLAAGFFTVSVASAATPARPSTLRATESAGLVSLRWEDRSTNESRFELQRRPEPGSFSTIAYPAPGAESAVDSVPAGAVRVYRLRAQNSDGSSSWSNLCWINANPARPTDLVVLQRSGTTVTLSWTDRSPNEYGFLVKRRVVGSSTWTTVGKVGPNVTQIQDSSAAVGTSYEYRVRAQGRPGICIRNSRWSSIVRSDPVSPAIYTLTIGKGGAGSGTVTSSPAGISCGAQCAAGFAQGTSVTLTATPAVGSTFSGWSGACAGLSSTCIVSMTGNKSATATFQPVTAACPTSGPIQDLRNDCSNRAYVYVWQGEIVEAIVTDGDFVAVGQTDGVSTLLYGGEVTSATTFSLVLIGTTPDNVLPLLDPGSGGSITSGGSRLNLTIKLDGDTYSFGNAVFEESVVAGGLARALEADAGEDLVALTRNALAAIVGQAGTTATQPVP